MALISCRGCQAQVSSSAASCPKCGCMLARLPGAAANPSGMAVASLVLGIIALPFSFCYGIGSIFGIVGFILAIIEKQRLKRECPDDALPGILVAGYWLCAMAVALPLLSIGAIMGIAVLVALGPQLKSIFP